MFALQLVITNSLDTLLAPFKGSHPFWALLLLSLLTTLFFLLVFRRTVPSSQIQAAKSGMQACLLEVRLFKDSPAVILAALAGLLGHNIRYLKSSFKPMLITLPGLLLLLIHLDAWFGHMPLRSNQPAVVTVRLAESSKDALDRISLEVSPEVYVETPALHLPADSSVSWSVRARKTGRHALRFQGPGFSALKTLAVSDRRWDRASPNSVAAGFWNHCLYPGESFLSAGSPVVGIEVSYPVLSISLLGWEMHWLVLFFLLSCGLGLVLARLMRVTV